MLAKAGRLLFTDDYAIAHAGYRTLVRSSGDVVVAAHALALGHPRLALNLASACWRTCAQSQPRSGSIR